jgi:hypothetical protein
VSPEGSPRDGRDRYHQGYRSKDREREYKKEKYSGEKLLKLYEIPNFKLKFLQRNAVGTVTTSSLKTTTIKKRKLVRAPTKSTRRKDCMISRVMVTGTRCEDRQWKKTEDSAIGKK